jgi:acetyl esterase/lipase
MRRLARATVLLLLAGWVAIPAAGAQQRLRRLIEQRRELAAAAPLSAGTRIEHDVAYGPDARQRYDVYLPAGLKPGAPILVMVHGGGWRTGDKGHAGVVGNKAAHWLGKGYVFVSVNYRLLPDADPVQQASDVAAAVASIQRRAAGWGADPARLVLMGHSAGAHLVALLGVSPSMLAKAGASPPRGVVALDSAAMDVPTMMAKPRLPALYEAAFGRDPAFWRSASPFHQLSRGAVPMLVVCSSRRPVACPQGRSLAARADGLGVTVEVLPEDLTHAAINHDLGADSAYTRAVSAWIDRRIR